MRRTFVTFAVAVALAGAASTAVAQGYAVSEHGTCAMARGGTGVANPCSDGSAIFFNPAGIIGPKGWTISVGVTGIDAYGSFTADATRQKDNLQNNVIPVPHVYIVDHISDKVAAGIGMFAPYGLGTRWDSTSMERYVGYDNNVTTLYFQPTLAVAPNPYVSIGAGFDFVYGTSKLTQRLDLADAPAAAGATFGMLGIPPGTDFASAQLTGNATTATAHFGVIVHATPWLDFGARYLMKARLNYNGHVDFHQIATGIVLPPQNPVEIGLGLDPTKPLPIDAILSTQFLPGAALGNQDGGTSLPMPDQAVAGVAVRVTPDLQLLADAQWIHWAEFDTLKITFTNAATPDEVFLENFKNTIAGRVGLDWKASDGVNVRLGYLRHGAAEPTTAVTPLLPGGLRNEFTGGLGLKLSSALHADVAYQFIRQQKRRGRVVNPPSGVAPTPDLNSGLYTFNAHLFAVTLTARF